MSETICDIIRDHDSNVYLIDFAKEIKCSIYIFCKNNNDILFGEIDDDICLEININNTKIIYNLKSLFRNIFLNMIDLNIYILTLDYNIFLNKEIRGFKYLFINKMQIKKENKIMFILEMKNQDFEMLYNKSFRSYKYSKNIFKNIGAVEYMFLTIFNIFFKIF